MNGFNAVGSVCVQTGVGRDARLAGTIVDAYECCVVGTLAIISDPLLRKEHGEAYIVNTNKMSKRWFVNDALGFRQEPSNSRSFKETLQGQFALSFKDTEIDFARLYGIV